MSAFTVDKVQRVVAAVRRELQAHYAQEPDAALKVDATEQQLQLLSKILTHLETCTDKVTTENILKEIFASTKNLWSTVSKRPQTALSQAASKAESEVKESLPPTAAPAKSVARKLCPLPQGQPRTHRFLEFDH